MERKLWIVLSSRVSKLSNLYIVWNDELIVYFSIKYQGFFFTSWMCHTCCIWRRYLKNSLLSLFSLALLCDCVNVHRLACVNHRKSRLNYWKFRLQSLVCLEDFPPQTGIDRQKELYAHSHSLISKSMENVPHLWHWYKCPMGFYPSKAKISQCINHFGCISHIRQVSRHEMSSKCLQSLNFLKYSVSIFICVDEDKRKNCCVMSENGIEVHFYPLFQKSADWFEFSSVQS